MSAALHSLAGAGGFFVGRNTDCEGYGQGVSTLTATESTSKSLYSVIGSQIDDPVSGPALAKLYGVHVGDRDALVKCLRDVAWVPAYRPAPFIGHMARPTLGGDPHINMLGFRDERQSYITKPSRTVRIFMTGGSTAWGSGASLQKMTISYLLEGMLNEEVSPASGYRYEVVNTAFPAWTTTQERLLIQQRLVDMYPDVILMFSGTNDIHWTREGRDIRWYYSPMDENFVSRLGELYSSNGRPDWTFAAPALSRPVECSDLARISARNVEDAAIAAGRAGARLIFAVQPNVATVAKRLTLREQGLPEVANRAWWESSYGALRQELGRIRARNYQLIDLSRSLGEIDDDTEVFVDSYHFADLGNRLMARALVDKIDWRSMVPSAAVEPDGAAALKIVNLDASSSAAEKPLNRRPDGSIALRIVPNRINENLLVVFDTSILPTVITKHAISASVPAALRTASGEHKLSIVDSMTGETSSTVVFRTR